MDAITDESTSSPVAIKYNLAGLYDKYIKFLYHLRLAGKLQMVPQNNLLTNVQRNQSTRASSSYGGFRKNIKNTMYNLPKCQSKQLETQI